jgi:hypothetical protein
LPAQIFHAAYAGFYILLGVPVTLLYIHERSPQHAKRRENITPCSFLSREG